MNARSRSPRTFLLVLGAALCLFASGVRGQVPENLQRALDALKSPSGGDRLNAANALTANWQASLPGIVAALDAALIEGRVPPYSEADAEALLPLTDVARTIVVNIDGGIVAFRELNSEKTIRLLAWLARSGNQALRLNATFILANVLDNGYLCLVLRHLRDPGISENGIVNLLQVAASVASYANQENAQAIEATLQSLEGRLPGPKSREIAQDLAKRVSSSRQRNAPLPPGSFCRTYSYNAAP